MGRTSAYRNIRIKIHIRIRVRIRMEKVRMRMLVQVSWWLLSSTNTKPLESKVKNLMFLNGGRRLKMERNTGFFQLLLGVFYPAHQVRWLVKGYLVKPVKSKMKDVTDWMPKTPRNFYFWEIIPQYWIFNIDAWLINGCLSLINRFRVPGWYEICCLVSSSQLCCLFIFLVIRVIIGLVM